MLLRAYGKNKYKRLIQQNLDQIKYLSELIEKAPFLELSAPVSSNVVCFRYVRDGLTEDELEKLNKAIRGKLMMSSFAIISDTTLNGKYMLRACNVNHRSKREDFDFLVNEIKKIGEELAQS
jgi:glutamate/tyrosine decarboxylase-like PLP-dependent enzyme